MQKAIAAYDATRFTNYLRYPGAPVWPEGLPDVPDEPWVTVTTSDYNPAYFANGSNTTYTTLPATLGFSAELSMVVTRAPVAPPPNRADRRAAGRRPRHDPPWPPR
ncbi:MAG TPA: hypothetical protein VID25_10665 [Candidatus Limnocylindrales bacterium]